MRGGCLCLAGDCGNCLSIVDNIAYTRACQTPAKPGMIVQSWPDDGYPPLPTNMTIGKESDLRHVYCDAVVVGAGASGSAEAARLRAAGKDVLAFDANNGEEVIGVYAGPMVVARTAAGMVNAHAREEIIVATGAMEVQPVAPGNRLAGIVTPYAAERMLAAGLDLGKLVAVGDVPTTLQTERVTGTLVRFEGGDRVNAVVVRSTDGKEVRHKCDTVCAGLGLYPRDALARMGRGLPVRAVGDATREAAVPPCPLAGTVCGCAGVDVSDLQFAWDHGFHELELMKRATLAGTGTCQGGACIPYLRSFIKDRGGELQAPFTARPVARQPTMGEVAAGMHHRATPRTALDAEHRRLGASMDRIGGWWRPYNYGNWQDEYWAVREAVSIGDVSTLGKMQIAGPDALEFLERLYPTKIATIQPGRSRYVLILDDRGYVMDDGLVCNDGNGRYTLTFTSGGTTMAEMWLRDWADSWGLDIRLLNQTMSLGAINVTGPLAATLLQRAGLTQPPAFLHTAQAPVAGIDCRIYRLSFTGELSYELHHPAEHSVTLWRALLGLGADLGIKPHGIEALLKLRLEKGHVIVGQDTDFDSTARRIDMSWAVKTDKTNATGQSQDFVGRQAVLRTNKHPLDKQLCPLQMPGPAPFEGALINHLDGSYAGYVTSSTWSPVLNQTVMLGWVRLKDGALPDSVMIQGRIAARASIPFYDKENRRARA